ncbi:hypothetical protein QSJ18_13605 [Gordonia sp. ABSL1-1]|uniref:sacsin N-terminal ATP-binding-like domain-containing protein n=1 Tax=Gordonia sp. ABSL1-1 TaxID=3053923 RepID=UPI002572A90D|nr:hypothetical protein [Gordonia sp. ABSL1-1]MDL9937784.1 hypothetical protein [Gordonia sp. ABSL1-1]
MTGPDTADPFGTAAIRASTLAAWTTSTTRLAEDVATETDLVTVGYRDRLLTELAANAADAAAAAGVPGHLAVWIHGTELHVANTGAPLTADGVRSLSALRVSGKPDGPDTESAGTQVGRFGVGFSATAAVADRVELRSTTGTVLFDRTQTCAAVQAEAGRAPRPDEVPLLRLPWPGTQAPTDGFDTEVVLTLHADLAATSATMLAEMRTQAADLLLELDALSSITIGDWRCDIDESQIPGEAGPSAAVLTLTAGAPGAEPDIRRWTQVRAGATRWLVRTDGTAGAREVLRAPTPTGIELSLPARVITALPLTPDRRHLHPDADITSAATGYVDLMVAIEPARRLALVPEEHRARNRDDARLVTAVRAQLTDGRWLPGADGTDLIPTRASVLMGLTAELARVLEPIFADLVHPDLSGSAQLPVLHRLGVHEIGLAALADRLVGVDREPVWWHALYSALAPLVPTSHEAAELAALPVPRADGRMAIGVRGVVVPATELTRPLSWLPTVHPDAVHPLLERLGAQRLSISEALSDPGLRSLVEGCDPDDDPVEDAQTLLDDVVALLRADPDAPVPGWLAALPLLDVDGELRPADELLLADSPLRSVLVDDHPFGLVADEVYDHAEPAELRRLGVGYGFLLTDDELPTAPDHDLPDEQLWWDRPASPPERLRAVRDLDLIDESCWAAALELMVADPVIAELLTDRDGYTAWWLRRYAVIGGLPLGRYRAPSDTAHAGVLDVLDHPDADRLAGALAGPVPEQADDAATLLSNLADADRSISPGVAVGVHAALVAAYRAGVFGIDDLPSGGVARAMSGEVVDDGLVLDRPWLAQVLRAGEVVLAGTDADPEAAELLAEILDLPTASEVVHTWVTDVGQAATKDSAPAVRFAVESGRPIVVGEVRLHDDLRISVRHNDDPVVEVSVRWWVDERGVAHLRR